MIKQIRVDQLQPGMYIHDLNCGWLDHPFLTSSFAVRDSATIEKIISVGIREVYIDTVKGGDVRDGKPEQEINADLERQLADIARKQPEKPAVVSLANESARARRLHVEAAKVASSLMDALRIGEPVDRDKMDPMVGGIIDSVFRNPDALLPLARLKSHHEYTYQHAISGCALMAAFARSMNLPKQTVHDVSLGGLLLDIGKLHVPGHILDKPGRLTDEEFALMQSHVAKGVKMLKDIPGINKATLQVVAEHHERRDGTGYPRKLQGDQISLYGQMAGIVDVYDAITSETVYHKGMTPPAALKKLLEWSEHHFDPQLVQTFIRTIGVYPTGTLVRLESNRMGVVVEQNEGKLLEPTVRVFYHAVKKHYTPPELVDLSKARDRIAGVESFEKWQIDPYQWLPS